MFLYRVKQERDDFEEQLQQCRDQSQQQQLQLETSNRENLGLAQRMETLKIQAKKSSNVCSEAKQELTELQRKYAKVYSDCETASKLLRGEREKCADLHQKVVTLTAEATLRSDDLNSCQQERVHLRDQLDQLSSQNDQLQQREEQLSRKCRSVSTELEKCQLKSSRCQQEYEVEIAELRTSLLSLTQQHRDVTDVNAKLERQVLKLKFDIQHLKVTREKEISVLRGDLETISSSLKAYQELEKEYETSLRAMATAADGGAVTSEDARIFPSLSLKGNKVLEQTVKLSSKVLKLERENHDAKTTIRQLTAALGKLRDSLYSYKCAVTNMAEPAHALQERLILQEDQITVLQAALQAANSRLQQLTQQQVR